MVHHKEAFANQAALKQSRGRRLAISQNRKSGALETGFDGMCKGEADLALARGRTNPVAVADCRQPMGDKQRGPAHRQLRQGRHDAQLRCNNTKAEFIRRMLCQAARVVCCFEGACEVCPWDRNINSRGGAGPHSRCRVLRCSRRRSGAWEPG